MLHAEGRASNDDALNSHCFDPSQASGRRLFAAGFFSRVRFVLAAVISSPFI